MLLEPSGAWCPPNMTAGVHASDFRRGRLQVGSPGPFRGGLCLLMLPFRPDQLEVPPFSTEEPWNSDGAAIGVMLTSLTHTLSAVEPDLDRCVCVCLKLEPNRLNLVDVGSRQPAGAENAWSRDFQGSSFKENYKNL